MSKLLLIPLVLFVVLVVFLAVGLRHDPHKLPSALINKPAPEFALPELREPGKIISPNQMRGKVWLLNVWASWCVGCREEHPFLLDIARSGVIPIWSYGRINELARGAQRVSDPYVLNVTT